MRPSNKEDWFSSYATMNAFPAQLEVILISQLSRSKTLYLCGFREVQTNQETVLSSNCPISLH